MGVLSEGNEAIRKELMRVAKIGTGNTITYYELTPLIPRSYFQYSDSLTKIANYERSMGRPFLTSIVVEAGSQGDENCKNGYPKGGFFGLDGIPEGYKRKEGEFWESLTKKEKEFVWIKQNEVWDFKDYP